MAARYSEARYLPARFRHGFAPARHGAADRRHGIAGRSGGGGCRRWPTGTVLSIGSTCRPASIEADGNGASGTVPSMVPPIGGTVYGGTAWCRQRAARHGAANGRHDIRRHGWGGGRRGKALRGLAGTPGGALWNRLANRPGRSPPGNRRAARRPAGFRRMSCGAGRALDRRADPAAAGTPAAACNGCRSAACLHAGATAPAETVPAGTVPGITAPGTVPPSMVPPDIVPPEWCLLVWCSLLAARYSEARYQAALFLAARYTEARCVVPPIGGTVPGALCPPGQSAGRRREWCRPVGQHGVPPIRSGRRAVVRRLLPAGTCRRGDRPGGGGGGGRALSGPCEGRLGASWCRAGTVPGCMVPAIGGAVSGRRGSLAARFRGLRGAGRGACQKTVCWPG